MIIVCENNNGFVNIGENENYWVDIVRDDTRGIVLIVLRFSKDDTSKILAICNSEDQAREIVIRLLRAIENNKEFIRINDIKPKVNVQVLS